MKEESLQYVFDPNDTHFLGLKKKEAIALAEKSKYSWRIILEDGVISPVSMKVRDERINFIIAKGRVIRVRRG